MRACAAGGASSQDGDSGDYILLLQHFGPESRSACVQVGLERSDALPEFTWAQYLRTYAR